MSKKIYVIPDTNLLIQCHAMVEIPWFKEFQDFDGVTVVLVSPVIRELDRQKNLSGRLGNRARKANFLIRQLYEKDRVILSESKGGKPVELTWSKVKPNQDIKEALDYSCADDQIIGIASSILKTKGESDSLVVMSNDNIVLLKAKEFGIPSRPIPKEWFLPDETSEEDKKIKLLEEENRKLKMGPVISVSVSEPTKDFIVNSYGEINGKDIDSLIERITHEFPMETNFSVPKANQINEIWGDGALNFEPAPRDEITTYREVTYPGWVSSCRYFFRRLNGALQNNEKRPRISVEIENKGVCPAEDLVITFSILGHGMHIAMPSERDEVKVEIEVPPAPPKGDISVFGVNLGGLKKDPRHSFGVLTPLRNTNEDIIRRSALINSISPVGKNDFQLFEYCENDRLKIDLKCSQWRHQSKPHKIDFEIVWGGPPVDRKGALEIEIHASNLKVPIIETIPIEIFVREKDTLVKAEEVLEDLFSKAKKSSP